MYKFLHGCGPAGPSRQGWDGWGEGMSEVVSCSPPPSMRVGGRPLVSGPAESGAMRGWLAIVHIIVTGHSGHLA